MPYNPNDPNSDPNNPEGVEPMIAPDTTPENEITPEDAVRRIYPQIMVRDHSPEAEAIPAKLDKILTDKRNKLISEEQADALLNGVITGDLPTVRLDPIAHTAIMNAIVSIRNFKPL